MIAILIELTLDLILSFSISYYESLLLNFLSSDSSILYVRPIFDRLDPVLRLLRSQLNYTVWSDYLVANLSFILLLEKKLLICLVVFTEELHLCLCSSINLFLYKDEILLIRD